MAKRIKLFISGHREGFSGRLPGRNAKIVKKFLDGAADGELFSSIQLSLRLNIHPSGLVLISHELKKYSYSLSANRRYWGKPATVAQLKRETER